MGETDSQSAAGEASKPKGDLAPLQQAATQLQTWVQAGAALTGGVALAGYIALRAWHNWLGFPMRTTFDADRYLMTAIAFASQLLVWSLVLLIPAWLLASTIEAVTKWILVRTGKPKEVHAAQVARALDVLVTLLQLFAIGFFFFWRSQPAFATEVAMRLPCSAAQRVDVPFELLIGAVIITLATHATRQISIQQRPQLRIWRALTLSLILFLLPQAYAVARMPASFPRAKLVLVSNEKEATTREFTGLQVAADEDQIALWNARDGRGHITSFQRDVVSSIELGPSESILDFAPECSSSKDGGP